MWRKQFVSIRFPVFRNPTTPRSFPVAASNSNIPRGCPHAELFPTPAIPRNRTFLKCGAWISGTNFLDETWPAAQRLNTLTLWNLHPFPFHGQSAATIPNVALADVMRTTLPFDTTYALTRPRYGAHRRNLRTSKHSRKMTVEEKIRFWQDVMEYAHDRGIDVYLLHGMSLPWAADGKYGITTRSEQSRSPLIISVKVSARLF